MESFRFPMRSILILALLAYLANFPDLRANEPIPYFSPGIKIGWDSNRGFTMGPKVGIGLAGLVDKFLNLMVGIKSFQTSVSDSRNFVFLDLQMGTSFKMIPGWLMVAELDCYSSRSKGNIKFCPERQSFFGFIVFPTLDFNFWSQEKISYEPGFELTLPIPLKKIDFGLE